MMRDVHNLIGIHESTSGVEYLGIGIEQLEEYGCDIYRDKIVSSARAESGRFDLQGNDSSYSTEYVVLATGFNDARPDPPLPRTGRGLHYCLHCDAHMFIDQPVYVMGSSDSAVHVAAIMLNFTDRVDILTQGAEPTWSEESAQILEHHPVDVVSEPVSGVNNDADGWLESMEFTDGSVREYKGGFAMYGAEYNNGLAKDLGCEIHQDGTVDVSEKHQWRASMPSGTSPPGTIKSRLRSPKRRKQHLDPFCASGIPQGVQVRSAARVLGYRIRT